MIDGREFFDARQTDTFVFRLCAISRTLKSQIIK